MNIYALSSGRGPSGIAIVRISGKDTLKVCKNLTKLKEINSNEVNYCKFYDPKNNKIQQTVNNTTLSPPLSLAVKLIEIKEMIAKMP